MCVAPYVISVTIRPTDNRFRGLYLSVSVSLLRVTLKTPVHYVTVVSRGLRGSLIGPPLSGSLPLNKKKWWEWWLGHNFLIYLLYKLTEFRAIFFLSLKVFFMGFIYEWTWILFIVYKMLIQKDMHLNSIYAKWCSSNSKGTSSGSMAGIFFWAVFFKSWPVFVELFLCSSELLTSTQKPNSFKSCNHWIIFFRRRYGQSHWHRKLCMRGRLVLGWPEDCHNSPVWVLPSERGSRWKTGTFCNSDLIQRWSYHIS